MRRSLILRSLILLHKVRGGPPLRASNNYNLDCYTLRIFVVHDVLLSNSSRPYEGVVQIITGNSTKNVCWQSLKNEAKDIVCRYLGYDYARFLVRNPAPTNDKDGIFSGSIDCNDRFHERYLSQCSINASASETCSEITYIHCIYGKIKRSKPYAV